jgi:hypothetical protein
MDKIAVPPSLVKDFFKTNIKLFQTSQNISLT